MFRHVTVAQPLGSGDPALEVFLVESNKIRNVNEVIAAGDDLETAASPFLDPKRATEDQLRTVLGRVSHLTSNWNPGDGGANSQAAAADEGYLSPLSVFDTGNTLFADYMPHNAAVFTLHDDLTWGGRRPGSIESATVSYVVYGFKAKDARRLLSSPTGIPTPASGSAAAASAEHTPIRICWGSLYNVKYHRQNAPDILNAAIVAKSFAEKQPIAIGEDVMDACTALLEGSTDARESGLSGVLGGLSSDGALPESNSQLDRAPSSVTNFKSAHGGYRWRLATDESQDEIFSGNQSPSTIREPALMRPEQAAGLGRLNAAQTYSDALQRRKRYVRHLIFCEWWKHRSLHGELDTISRQRRVQAVRRAKVLLERMEVINLLLTSTAQLVATIEERTRPYGPFTKGENRKFYSHNDPTFALRDIGSGWPAEWGSDASVIKNEQFDSWLSSKAKDLKAWVERTPFSKAHAPMAKSSRIPNVWERFVRHPGLSKLPIEMMNALRNIMMVASHELSTDNPGSDPLVTNPSWRECTWNGQPWLPLFVEWEAEYVHIPSEMWELRHDDDGTVHYGLRSDVSLENYEMSSRTFSGRAILLPDAQKILVGLLDMVSRTVPGAADLDNAGRTWAEKLLGGIQLLFGRLDGFTDHLLTLYQGAHVVPSMDDNSLDAGNDPFIRSLLASFQAAEDIFADQDDLKLLLGRLHLPGNSQDEEDAVGGLDVTPYGNSHEGLSYSTSRNLNRPADKDLFFRPVTHGQARLAQFKIVDRFGQVVCAADPRPDRPARSFYPHMGRGILCEALPADSSHASVPRTALPLKPNEIARGDCPWFQLSPRINQDARIHAEFMRDLTLPDGSCRDRKYQPVGAGEHAVFAWLLINFHNRSLQVYDGDGAFKGEAFLPSGPDKPVYWQSLLGKGTSSDILPHMLPDESGPRLQQHLDMINDDRSSTVATSAQAEGPASFEIPMSLEDLVVSMSHAPFLIQLWDTVVAAQDHIMTPPPQQYAQLPSALIGRPLALARLGLGVELATAPMRSQAYADYRENYQVDGEASGDDNDPSETTGDEDLTHYAFAVKLGDMLGRQDGLVAYFRPPPPDTTDQPAAWTIATDYTPKSRPRPTPSSPGSSVHVQHSSSAPPLTVRPAYPRLLPPRSVPREALDAENEVQEYMQRRAESLYTTIVTVLLDPYLPVSVRSGILPVVTAKLGRAIVEHEIAQLGVWLRTGPLLIGARGADPVTSEVGKMRIQVVENNGNAAASAAGPRVPVQTPPAVMMGAEWRWVQPVNEPLPESSEEGEQSAALDAPVTYVRLGTMDPLRTGFDAALGADDKISKSQEVEVAVALEGYLVLEKAK